MAINLKKNSWISVSSALYAAYFKTSIKKQTKKLDYETEPHILSHAKKESCRRQNKVSRDKDGHGLQNVS
jgi:hypothetical protein